MSERAPDQQPGERRPPRGRGRLAEPPSARYERRAGAERSGDVPEQRSAAAAVAAATGVALGGALLLVVLAGVFAVGAGLVVAAVAIGRFVGLAVASGRPALGRSASVALAVGLAVVSVALGQVGTWLWARTEGGVLGPFDYLAQTFGVLAPLEFLGAALVAWWTIR